MNRNKLLPVHPGEVLLENFFEPLGISQDRVAKELNVPPRRIYEIVRGERSINADMAHRLAHYFGMSERYWLDLQARYDGTRERESPTQFSRKQSLRYVG
ncbi:MAG: HigA family addiction module antidote protein [Deltaproteobacteria bacterium]|nr:HigA family addiction module antidote protein [Deltaproteobacteria bacterium]